VQKIVDNLTRQHKELARAGTQMLAYMDVERLRTDPGAPIKAIATLTGILRVHLSMEDASFYPSLLSHADASVRQLANRYLDERRDIQVSYDAYRARWSTSAAIGGSPEKFIEETKAILYLLWTRMRQEDEELHPAVVKST
jgi:Hemerythrin HHE cation binding domain